MKPRENDGRFALANLERLCVCGHTLGQHAAGNGRPGVPRDCLAHATDASCSCRCANFKASRKRNP